MNVIQTGPPSPYPVMLRVTGYDPEKVRQLATQVGDVMAGNPKLSMINFDWNEKVRCCSYKWIKIRHACWALIARVWRWRYRPQLSGAAIAEFYQNDKTVNIVFRMDAQNRQDLAHIKDIPIHIGNGKVCPVGSNRDPELWGRRWTNLATQLKADHNGSG